MVIDNIIIVQIMQQGKMLETKYRAITASVRTCATEIRIVLSLPQECCFIVLLCVQG